MTASRAWCLAVAAAGVFACSDAAHAQDALQSEQTTQWEDMPMASSGTDPRLERRMSRMGRGAAAHRTGPVGSIYVGVPIANDVDRDVIKPGGSIDLRGGIDLGYVVPEIEVGFMGLPVRPEKIDPTLDERPLKQFYFGFGLRLQIPNRSPVVPYLSGAFDFQFWNLLDQEVVCDYWYCWERNDYDFTPGFTGRGGLAIKLRPNIALDINLRVGMSFEGNAFDDNQSWVQPSLGVSFWK